MTLDKTKLSASNQSPNSKNKAVNFWLKYWKESLIILLAALGLYAYSIQFEYVLDDKIVISENNFVKKGYSGIKEILTTESFAGYFGSQKDLVVGARYRPLSIVTFAIEYAHFGLNPKISHLINVLLYILSGLLIFRLISLLIRKKKATHWLLGIPFLTALIFIIHPVHSEVVANVKGRDEIMTLLFSLLAFYSFFKAQGKQKILWSSAGVISFFLALLSKENALTFIAIIPLGLYFFTKIKIRSLVTPTILLVLTGLVYLYLRFSVIGYFLSSGKEITDIMNNPFAGLETGEKYATIFYTLGLYLKLLFFPHPLTHDYYPYHIPVMTWAKWQAFVSLLLNAGLIFWALILMKRKSILSFGILFYFITLSIVSNLPFTVGTFMNERFLYISSLGFCLIIAWLISEVIPNWLGERKGSLGILNSGLLGILVLGFMSKTIERVPAWKDTFSLNSAAIKVSKNSARANLFMGTAIFNLHLEESDPQRKKQCWMRQNIISDAP